MATLAIYDVMKIQDFVFNSNKTRENLGASIIVQQVFEKGLMEAITKICGGNCELDWKKAPYKFEMLENEALEAEVVYIGGGNAMVVYKNRSKGVEITKYLSNYVLEKTGGMLQFAVSYLPEFEEFGNFHKNKSNLFIALKKNKAERSYSFPMLGNGITYLGASDGLPASLPKMDEELLSASARKKREAFKDSDLYFAKKLGEDYKFPKEFDKLGQKPSENYVAVVHIDGNSMGQTLDKILGESKKYEKTVPILREFSKSLDEIFIDTFKQVISNLKDKIKQDQKFKDSFEFENDEHLPIRPIVLNGDDVTFVCNGRLGVTLAENFLRELNKKSPLKLETSKKEIPISASAGVAIIKSHFPFYRAYELAEELCKSAKTKGKTLSKIAGSNEAGNWLDYHIVYSGVTTSLNELREKYYCIPGLDLPNKIQHPQNIEKPEMSYKQYNLLWRPWCVVGGVDNKYNWDKLKTIFDDFKNNWKRSRLKTLRNAMIKSENQITTLLSHYKSRGFKLPEFDSSREVFRDNNQTPYFDALELLDYFIQLEKTGGTL